MNSENNHTLYNSLFPTHEVGSMRKLNATVLALQNRKLTTNSVEEVEYWWSKLKLGDHKDFIQFLQLPVEKRPENWEQQVLVKRLEFNLRFLESTGLDFVYTGEALRREMYEHIAKDIGGIFLENEHIRSFDDRFYKPGVRTTQNISLQNPTYSDEYSLAKEYVNVPLRFCFTGPYTVFDWTIKQANSEEFLFDLVKEVYIPITHNIIKAGAKYITSDEPAYTTKPAERELYLEAYKEYFKGIKEIVKENDVKIGFHTCFSNNYEMLFEDIPKLPWDYASLEFANRDLKKPGITDKERPVYAEVMPYVKQAIENGAKTKYTLGILEVHAHTQYNLTTNAQENIQEFRAVMRDRLVYQANNLYDHFGSEGLKYILSGPDCGLRPVSSLKLLHTMLETMVNATKDARNIFADKWEN
ncbi:MAG: hypothetical protein ACXAC7_02915 [Candidatus Hodarchaeales archaeon]|jgi:5-methyltetrahydropteroyltriglutamate--homocysteine methyltransferase